MKTIVVTGTTSGIGYETALGIIQRGDHLVAINRSKEKMERCIADWKEQFPHAQISAYYADLASMREIRSVCMKISIEHPCIDVLINNAGIYLAEKEITEDGWEKTFTVNHMAYVAVTRMLLPAVEQSEGGRIVNVASRAHLYSLFDIDTVDNPKRYQGQRVYGTSKLCNILYTRELAKRLEEKSIAVYCLHPGVVNTGFAREQGGLMGWGFRFFRRLFLNPAEGAKTSLFLAYDPSVVNETGGYYAKCAQVVPSREAQNDILAEKLWEKSMRLLDLAWDKS
jgi:retinol dehydrogenase-12